MGKSFQDFSWIQEFQTDFPLTEVQDFGIFHFIVDVQWSINETSLVHILFADLLKWYICSIFSALQCPHSPN